MIGVLKKSYSQCSGNPLNVHAMASGAFDQSNTGKTAALILTNDGEFYMYSYLTDHYNFIYSGTTIDVSKVQGRMVEGDFDGDGKINDVAILYNNGGGSMSIECWHISLTSATFLGNMWTSSGYDADKITGRIVSGDFDNDGYFDDIAAFYDYGNGNTKIHVWTRNNGQAGFQYSWWWQSSGYYCSAITYRVVSGDFDRDGYYDDVAVFYDYGGGAMRIHVFKSNGSSFIYQGPQGWWSTQNGYTPSNINKRIISGNFDRSGVINHKNDDIVALYDYGNGNTKVHAWTSNGTSFSYSWKWQVSGFNANNATGRLVNFQYDYTKDPQKCFDMAAFYNYGPVTDKFYHWTSTGSWNFSSFTNTFCSSLISDSIALNVLPEKNISFYKVYPNPNHGVFSILGGEKKMRIEIYDILGKMIYNNIYFEKQIINMEGQKKGMYVIKLTGDNGENIIKKILIQ